MKCEKWGYRNCYKDFTSVAHSFQTYNFELSSRPRCNECVYPVPEVFHEVQAECSELHYYLNCECLSTSSGPTEHCEKLLKLAASMVSVAMWLRLSLLQD